MILRVKRSRIKIAKNAIIIQKKLILLEIALNLQITSVNLGNLHTRDK